AILYYDYILTLPAEIEYIWLSGRLLSFPSAIFIVNRYLALVSHIPYIYESFVRNALYNVWTVIFLLRVHALYRKRTILAILVVCILGAMGFALTWSGVLVYDLAIFLLTLNKCLREHWRSPWTLWHVFVLDGTTSSFL
ncbi:hypothetical protein K488DRAFT_56100, partial [Vararia minispora EC-137]